MKIVHIQFSMPPAGNACFRLHSAMRERGVDSSIYNIRKSIAYRNYISSPKRSLQSYFLEIYSYLHGSFIKHLLRPNSYFFSYKPFWGAKLHSLDLVKDADVIYLHWVAGGCLQFNEIDKIASTGKLIIFFMHDMWDFTGGCHHSFDCLGYESGCANCPMFKDRSNIAHKQIEDKFRLFSKYPNIIFVSPSKWLAECAKKSYALQKSRVYTISNVVDETIFKPINKKLSREILNLPLDKKIITFGCQAGTNNPYKGWKYLKEAMDFIKRDDLHILIYGVDYQKETQEQISYPITFMGPVFDETKLSLICNATDIFVSPSLAESFGLTFLENILCGTPVVGFNNTAVNEIVKTEETGYLAVNKDPEDLARGIQYLLDKIDNFTVQYNYSTDYIVGQHINLVQNISQGRHE